MPLPLTTRQLELLDPYLLGEEEAMEPEQTLESFFGLPPAMPTTNFFSGSRGYGGSRQDPYRAFERASELRRVQQAEREAQELFKDFRKVDPASRDYPKARLGLIQRYPMAVQDPRGKALWQAADMAYEQSNERDPNRELLQRAAIANIQPEEVELFRDQSGRLNTVALGNAIGIRERELRPSRERNPLDTEIDTLAKQFKFMDETGQSNSETGKALRAMLEEKMRQKVGFQTPSAAVAAPDKATQLRSKYNY
jgi:hypothetical protein